MKARQVGQEQRSIESKKKDGDGPENMKNIREKRENDLGQEQRQHAIMKGKLAGSCNDLKISEVEETSRD